MFDLLDMFLGVAGAQDLQSGDGASGVERDEEVVGAGIADELVGLGRGGEQATDGIAASVCDEVQPALGITKLDPIGRRKELARLSKRDGGAALRLLPAGLLVNEDDDHQQHSAAVKAQEQLPIQHAGHCVRHPT